MLIQESTHKKQGLRYFAFNHDCFFIEIAFFFQEEDQFCLIWEKLVVLT